ncbi:sugar transferase [uncultured Sunxiuqinia sp.]|uniref:sugar transferase n=1 Tax=uncultured Sunxiuqinia sp. TaxID=1573825 RepID=UPI0026105B79|nr:sugar transferase [uncultured Sunxiuqinia sp.]
MKEKVQVARYLFFDFIAAATSWTFFYVYRKRHIEPQLFQVDVPLELTQHFFLALVLIPLFWIFIYYFSGYYSNIFRKSRLLELGQTFLSTLTGVIILFFCFLLDDYISGYQDYYKLFVTLFLLHFCFTYLFRLIQTSRIIRRIHQREFGFNTLLIGSNEKALNIYRELNSQPRPAGFQFIGFLTIDEDDPQILSPELPNLGNLNDLATIAEKHKLEEVIIAIESSQHDLLAPVLTALQNLNLTIWGIPDLYDLLSGNTHSSIIYGSPLLKISNGILPDWQAKLKRLIDISFSVLAILFFLPPSLIIAIIIKLQSSGPVLYKQERIGRFGKPFTIFKFRTMVRHAEKNGPELSGENDPRIIPVGQFLRRTHLDEIPQFLNVIKGEMSLVGPRPERKYFIEQIVQQAPHFSLLHKIRPGITSWGQVKYGYASSVEQMIKRLPYDLVYLKNRSIYIDFKILIYTLIACFKGDGK